MFASLDPNYKPVDLYRAFWKSPRNECWGGITRKERHEWQKPFCASVRELIKDRRSKAQAEADLKELVKRHPELKDKMQVQEFGYL